MSQFPHTSQKGFSLVEALVVVSITVVLTSILVVHSRTSEKQIIFFRDQSLFVSAILRAKAFSIETFQPKLQPGLAPSVSNRVCGWGVSFNKTNSTLIIFNDLASGGGSANCGSPNQNFIFDTGENFETITLDPAITIDCVGVNPAPGGPCVNQGQVHVTFLPPDPTVSFVPSGAEAVIVLKLTDPTQSRTSTIRISEAGQVSVN